MKQGKTALLIGVFAVIFLVLSSQAWAAYPNRTIQLITQVPAGNPAYALSQVLAEKMGKILGQKIVVNAQPGASGVKAARYVLSKPADGYTIFDAWVAGTVIAVISRPNAGYTYKSFTPLGRVNLNPITLVVRGDSPVRNPTDFLEWARNNPGLSYACAGDRSIPHGLIASLARQKGLSVKGIPFNGIGAGIKDLLGGTLDFSVGFFPLIERYGDKINTLCVFLDDRHPWYPDLPTCKEFDADPGYGDAGAGWNAYWVKKGVPSDRLEKLQSAFKQVMLSDDFLAYARKSGFAANYADPDAVYRLSEQSSIKIKEGLEDIKWEKRQFMKN